MVRIERVLVEQKEILFNLMQLYLYEFTDFVDDDFDEKGIFPYEYFDLYWQEPERFPFFIFWEGKLVGFVLVRFTGDKYAIAEFFVARRYRGKGIGKSAAIQVFEIFKGDWEVSQLESNVDGIAFWRKVLTDYCKYSERKERGLIVQEFKN